VVDTLWQDVRHDLRLLRSYPGFALVVQGSLAWLACWIPARRAVRLDPAAALRCD
jgi:ABC-type lipoprotein release transport system permease subunit